jgi:hypothetical protein
MKRREELPFFKKLPYTFDVDRILKDFDLIKDKNDDLTIEGGYGDLVGSKAPKLENAFGIGKYTEYVDGMVKGDYTQVVMTQYNPDAVSRKYNIKINNKRPDERHYNLLRPELEGSYIQEVMNTFRGEATRTRIAILKPGAAIKPHIDYNTDYSVRYHIPLITNEQCGFKNTDKQGNSEEIHMGLGECWFLNQGFKHSAWNNGDTERWHLIVSVLTQEDLDD